MEYKKSYLGLILWIIGMLVVFFGSSFLPDMGMQIRIAIADNIMTISVFILTVIIYFTENVYWYNGTSYEEGLLAGSDRRKAFALAHMIRFGILAGAFLLYSFVSIVLGIPYGVDIAVATIGIIVAAFSTMKIKL
jgi:hypothetical protein